MQHDCGSWYRARASADVVLAAELARPRAAAGDGGDGGAWAEVGVTARSRDGDLDELLRSFGCWYTITGSWFEDALWAGWSTWYTITGPEVAAGLAAYTRRGPPEEHGSAAEERRGDLGRGEHGRGIFVMVAAVA